MPAIFDDEQRSYRAKSWLPFGLRRRRAMALSQLLSDVRHRPASLLLALAPAALATRPTGLLPRAAGDPGRLSGDTGRLRKSPLPVPGAAVASFR